MSEFPQFFETNKIIKDQDTFSASSGVGTVENIADYSRITKWDSIGSNDAVTENIEVIFLTPDAQEENRTIDRVILTGCNAKLFRLYTSYWNGASYDAYVLRDTVTDSAIENHIRTIASTSCGKIKIEMDTTIMVNEEKCISEFIATKLLWAATMPMDTFDIRNKQKSDIRRLYNGTAQMVNHYDKWSAEIEFKQITQTEIDALRVIYDTYDVFIIIAEPYDYLDAYDKPEEFYRVLWTSPWEQKYFTKVKSAGYNIKITLEEV